MVLFFGAAGILAGCSFIFFLATPRDTNAGPSHNLSGWAWSENIGWISFSSSNCDKNNNQKSDGDPGCPPQNAPISDYGVNIASGGGLSGYAWSEHIGWISFNPADTASCPAAPCAPTLNRSAGKLEGWAAALAADNRGWDGWIRLSGSNYGVSVSGCNYDDYAWGSDVVGWIHFRGEGYGVIGSSEGCGIAPNSPPAATNPSSCGGGISPQSAGCPSPAFGENPVGACALPLRPTLSWTYGDPNADPQRFYQVQVDDNSDFSSPILDTGKTQSPTNSYTLPADPAAYTPPNTALAFNTRYSWRVRVWDDRGRDSSWAEGPSFTTQPHWAPSVNYSWSPFRPNKQQRVQFTDASGAFDQNNNPVAPASWNWTFENGDPATSQIKNPAVRFGEVGLQATRLRVTDQDGLSCGRDDLSVPVEWPTPAKFREVVPE